MMKKNNALKLINIRLDELNLTLNEYKSSLKFKNDNVYIRKHITKKIEFIESLIEINKKIYSLITDEENHQLY